MHERQIRVWPDATWQDIEETPHSHMSDDFRVITVHSALSDEQVDLLATMASNGAPDEIITDEVIWMINI